MRLKDSSSNFLPQATNNDQNDNPMAIMISAFFNMVIQIVLPPEYN